MVFVVVASFTEWLPGHPSSQTLSIGVPIVLNHGIVAGGVFGMFCVNYMDYNNMRGFYFDSRILIDEKLLLVNIMTVSITRRFNVRRLVLHVEYNCFIAHLVGFLFVPPRPRPPSLDGHVRLT